MRESASDPPHARHAHADVDSTARVWSSEPPSVSIDQVRRRSAVELVSTLFETHLLKTQVKAAIQSDPALHEPLRSLALEIADRRGEDAQALYDWAWLCILRPETSPELSRQAQKRLEAACSLVADDPDRRNEYCHVLALALYRAGRADEALRVVARLNGDLSQNGDASPLSIDLAVTALASQKLGRHAEALAARDRLRALASAHPDDQQAAGFLHEVESVVHEIGTRKIDRY
ncbi:MAG: hypothetical protein ACLP7Q_06790 [Isosphaeraceae bacterium]